ncbi:hypothetical protein [Polyangium jinanense]|uniref:Uncharacterized protein n=1 Tax=Polyangium jinanense TaxID=2829994 RepID=A0A9X4AZF3_9BACT|nr:hypothetical protein [Polyangium jinanense]MDC3988117.1 hypothetical protein [Polyangium jinanense]
MSFVARCVGVVALVGCSFAGVARADEGAAEVKTEAAEIQLKNGGTMRGTIVTVEPGQRVIVIIAGEQSVIPWAEIAKIVGGTQGSAAPAPTPAPAPLAPAEGGPLVHIESNWPDLELARIDGDVGGGHHQPEYVGPNTITKFMCRAPCDKLVDGRDGHRFFISGPGMVPTESFRLEGLEGHVTARVKGVSMARFTGGFLGTVLGGFFVLSGVAIAGMSYTIDTTPTPEVPDPARQINTVRTIGLVTLGIGAAGFIGGIMLLSEGRTRVELVKAQKGNTGVVVENGILRF